MNTKILKRISLLSGWALLALGAGELVFVLIGPVSYLLANICVAILLVVFLSRLEFGNNLKKISGHILTTSLLLTVMTLLYNYMVLLEAEQLLMFNFVSVLTFCAAGHLTALLVKAKYVVR